MAEARSKERWSHTSALLALLANIHRDRKRKPTPYRPADFNPHRRRSEPARVRAPISVLKTVFVDRR